jgi:putative membrane protein
LIAAYALSAHSGAHVKWLMAGCIALGCHASAGSRWRACPACRAPKPRTREPLRLAAVGLQVFCVLLLLGFFIVFAAVAHAHDTTGLAVERWTPTPWLWLGFAASAALYARGYFVVRGRLGATLRRGPWRAACFALAIATLVLALLSPLDAWSDGSFSAHMVQHELLMLLAAPLLVLSRPLEPYFWCLPQGPRGRTLALIRRPVFARTYRVLTAPGVALLVHGLVRWMWHIPSLYEACLRNEVLHGIQHASFFLTAVLFWWAVLQGAHGRYGYGIAVVFVFATALHTGALGALITFASQPWYPEQTRVDLGLDPLADQQLAGFIMWIVAGTWLAGLGLALFVAWLGQAARRRPLTPVGVRSQIS